jgi:hypothetical protein
MSIGIMRLGRWKYIQRESLMSKPSSFYLKLPLQSLKVIHLEAIINFRHNWIRQEVKYFGLRSINSLIQFEVRNNCLSSERSLLFYQSKIMTIILSIAIIEEYNCYQLRTEFYTVPFFKVMRTRRRSYWGSLVWITHWSDFCVHQILEKRREYNETVHQLFINFKQACDSVGWEVL